MPIEGLGISLEGQPIPEVDTSQTLLICAGAKTVWNDLERLSYPAFPEKFDIMCVNDIYMHFPGYVKHFYSNDKRYIPRWVAARRELYNQEFPGETMTHSLRRGAMYNWHWPGHGTSSLNAAYTGLALGYNRIILCGVPLDDSPHYFEAPWRKSNFSKEVPQRDNNTMAYWTSAKSRVFDGKVSSMSGRTRELLGEPKWLT